MFNGQKRNGFILPRKESRTTKDSSHAILPGKSLVGEGPHVLLRTNCGVLSALSLLPAWSWATFWAALQDFIIYFPQGSIFPFTLYFGVLTVIISACLKHTWSPNWQISWHQTLPAWLRSYSWQQLTWNTTNWNVLSTSSFACFLAFF